MGHNMRMFGSILLFVVTLSLLLTAQVWAQEPEYFAEYVLHLQPPDKGIEKTAAMWFWTRHILSDLKTHDLVLQFECVEEENLVNVSARLEGLYQLQKLEWVVRIERQTDFGPEVVYDVQAVEQVQDTKDNKLRASLVPDDVTSIVDLPDATLVEGAWANAEAGAWGADWDNTDASRVCTPTFTNEHQVGNVTIAKAAPGVGNITIAKEAPGGGSTLFHFGGDLGLMALADGYTGTQYNIPADDYIVTEVVPSDWELIDVTCAGGDSDPYSDAYGEGVEIHLDTNEHITCTFTNEHQIGNITIAKEAPGGGSTLFHFGGDMGLMALADGYTGTHYNIPARDYVVTEVVPSDWALTDVTCEGGDSTPYSDSYGEGVTIHLDTSEHITCTFTNERLDKHIRGRVTDKDTGDGISGVNMSIDVIGGGYESGSATTDALGYYTFTVTVGEYDVNLPWTWNLPDGYALPVTTTQRVMVTTGDVSDVDFVLLPKNRSVSGRVTIRDTATGVEGVQMRLYSLSSYVSVYTETTSAGYYTFTEQAEGNYYVNVNDTPLGYVALPPTSLQVEVTATNRSGVDFEVRIADKTIRGTVSEVGGGGLAGVYVEASAYDTEYTYNPDTTTDANGAYTFTVPAGYFRIDISLPSDYAGRQTLRAPAGASGVDFSLQRRSQTITGQVSDYHLTSLPGASVYAENYGCYTYWGGYDDSTTTDASGYYTLTVIPGSYEVRVSKVGYPTPPYQEAQAGDNSVNFVMPEGFVIQGRVLSATEGDTVGLPYAYIYTYSTDECASARHNQYAWADANGYYTLTVDAGTYSVSAYKNGYYPSPAQSVTVGPDQNDVNLELSPTDDYYVISGTVRYPNGQPVYDAWVHTHSGPGYDSDWTDSNGQYELHVVISGTYDIAAEILNWPDPKAITGVVVLTHTYNVDLTAPEAYTVTGTVRRNDGTPWENIDVNAEGLEPLAEDEWDQADADGVYTLHVHQGGTYLFYPYASPVWPATPAPVSYTVSADMSGIDFQFGDAVTVTGMVSDTDGAPVPNAQVYIAGHGVNGAWNYDYMYTFYDGTYIAWFAEGSYSGSSQMYPCYVNSDEESFTLGAGGLSGLDFTIARKCGVITGQATDDQGQGVCDADVRIEYPGGSLFNTEFTAPDWHGQAGIGDYRALVPVGAWNLWASKSGFLGVQPVSRTVEIAACGVAMTGQDFEFITASDWLYLPLVLRTH